MLMGENLATEEQSAVVRLTDAQVNEFVDRYGTELLSMARRHSACGTDAEDAYQRTLEIVLVKAPTDDPSRLFRWAMTVVRNEALMIVRRQSRTPYRFDEVASEFASDTPEPELHAIEREQHGRRREALGHLKAGQVRCLVLRAEGLDYDQISRVTGFSLHQVGRYLCEGRRAARSRAERIETGAECERVQPVLSLMADDAADVNTIAQARLHLSHCLACRKALADFHAAPQALASSMPLLAAASGGASLAARVGDGLQTAFSSLQERLASLVPGSEMAAAKKLAGASLAIAAVAGGVTAAPTLVDSRASGGATTRSQVVAPAAARLESGLPPRRSRPGSKNLSRTVTSAPLPAVREATTADVRGIANPDAQLTPAGELPTPSETGTHDASSPDRAPVLEPEPSADSFDGDSLLP